MGVCHYRSDGNKIIFKQTANHSAGDCWKYKLSTDYVIKEREYFETGFPLSVGYTQNWEFDFLNEGEITINWICYKGGTLNKDNSYSETYLFDENGNLKKVTA